MTIKELIKRFSQLDENYDIKVVLRSEVDNGEEKRFEIDNVLEDFVDKEAVIVCDDYHEESEDEEDDDDE